MAVSPRYAMRTALAIVAFSSILVLASCGNNRGSTNGNNNNGDLDSFEFDSSDAEDVEEDRNWNDQGGQDVGEDPDVFVKPDADAEEDPDAQTQDVLTDPGVQDVEEESTAGTPPKLG